MRRAFVLAAAAAISWGASVTSVAGATEPVRCGAEDSPGWSWSQCGDRARGVILKSAPADCRWRDGFTPRCFTVVTVREYCEARKAHEIDRKRTASLKGDGYARDRGCQP